MKELDLKTIKTPFVLNDTDKVSHSASPTCCHLQWRGQYSGCYHYVVDKTSLDRTWAGGCWHVDILNLGSVEHSLFNPLRRSESEGGEVFKMENVKCRYAVTAHLRQEGNIDIEWTRRGGNEISFVNLIYPEKVSRGNEKQFSPFITECVGCVGRSTVVHMCTRTLVTKTDCRCHSIPSLKRKNNTNRMLKGNQIHYTK